MDQRKIKGRFGRTSTKKIQYCDMTKKILKNIKNTTNTVMNGMIATEILIRHTFFIMYMISLFNCTYR